MVYFPTMKLYAISDIHLSYASNREALEALPTYPEDWLILAGDVGETEEHLHFALSLLTKRFAGLLWVPGNHDLWSNPTQPGALHGEAKYQKLVSICRAYGVLTPEDPYVTWPGEGPRLLLVPLFLLYDYSFRPDSVPLAKALSWAAETGVMCRDELLLAPDPYASRIAWCRARCRLSEERLSAAVQEGTRFILINHFPLQERPVTLTRHPRLSLWSGTRTTADWHTRYPVSTVIYGHLHMRVTYYSDGVRFEEVSLGYPPHWRQSRGIAGYLRSILPESGEPHEAEMAPLWHW